MRWIDRTKLRAAAEAESQELLAGTFLNLGSPAAVEIAAAAGFDWLLLDLEHGSADLSELRPLLLAAATGAAAPIVRLRSVDPDAVKFVMDSGAAGIMFPFVSTAQQARAAVQAMKYPPQGQRGVAGAIRATGYGTQWKSYFESANRESLVVVQIETEEAVANADEIAAVDGVDVLFVGPLDLSVNLGCPGDFTKPEFVDALRHVVEACHRHHRVPGILTKAGHEQQHFDLGFRFVALGSDALSVVTGMNQSLSVLRGDDG